MWYQARGYTDIGGRTENEDSAAFREYGEMLVAVVADGLGGQGDGKAASLCIRDELIRCGENEVFPTAETISECFDHANTELMQRQKNNYHMKSTAVYLCVSGKRAVWAHVGDSRLYHLFNGKICDYTLDHSASQLSVFLGSINRENIPDDPGRNRLLRAMGSANTPTDVHEEIRMEQGRHGFLLCTDGLWEYLTDQQIEESFASSESADEWLRKIRDCRDQKAGEDSDNNTAIVIVLKQTEKDKG